MKEVLNVIEEAEEFFGIVYFSDLKTVKGQDKFSFYLETKGICKEGKVYSIKIEEV